MRAAAVSATCSCCDELDELELVPLGEVTAGDTISWNWEPHRWSVVKRILTSQGILFEAKVSAIASDGSVLGGAPETRVLRLRTVDAVLAPYLD